MERNLAPNINDPDGFHDALLGAHNGLSKDESDAFNARLNLILANRVGDRSILRAALEFAK